MPPCAQVGALLCSIASSTPGRRLLDTRLTLDFCQGLLAMALLRLSDSVPVPEPVKGAWDVCYFVPPPHDCSLSLRP